MEIIVGKTAGFCYGVKRAVEGAENEVKKNNKNTYCLGEIVHNKDVVKDLENKGIEFINDLDSYNNKINTTKTTIIKESEKDSEEETKKELEKGSEKETKKELEKDTEEETKKELKKDTKKEIENKNKEEIKKESQEEKKLIIRAHGIPKETYEKAKEKNFKIIDYTCPNVLKIHKIAEEKKDNHYIILFGNINHPENIGTISYCGKNYSVIEEKEDIEKALKKVEESNLKKLLIISQTTYSIEKFNEYSNLIQKKLENKNIEIEIKNTICKATEIRQKETEEISKKVDLMIIIGGKNSSNTKKLYEIAQKHCGKAILIENKDQIDLKEIENAKKIGIMAGASTPEEKIKEVIHKLKK